MEKYHTVKSIREQERLLREEERLAEERRKKQEVEERLRKERMEAEKENHKREKKAELLANAVTALDKSPAVKSLLRTYRDINRQEWHQADVLADITFRSLYQHKWENYPLCVDDISTHKASFRVGVRNIISGLLVASILTYEERESKKFFSRSIAQSISIGIVTDPSDRSGSLDHYDEKSYLTKTREVAGSFYQALNNARDMNMSDIKTCYSGGCYSCVSCNCGM